MLAKAAAPMPESGFAGMARYDSYVHTASMGRVAGDAWVPQTECS